MDCPNGRFLIVNPWQARKTCDTRGYTDPCLTLWLGDLVDLVYRWRFDHVHTPARPTDFRLFDLFAIAQTEVQSLARLRKIAASRVDLPGHRLFTDRQSDDRPDCVAIAARASKLESNVVFSRQLV